MSQPRKPAGKVTPKSHDAKFAPSAHVDTFARDHLPPRNQWPDLVFDLPELHYPARMNSSGSRGSRS